MRRNQTRRHIWELGVKPRILAKIFIPTMLQKLTYGVKQVELEARNVRQVIEQLDGLYPGIKDRLVEDGEILPNLAVAIESFPACGSGQ